MRIGKRVQTINAPGSETGPGTVATWGKAIANEVDGNIKNVQQIQFLFFM